MEYQHMGFIWDAREHFVTRQIRMLQSSDAVARKAPGVAGDGGRNVMQDTVSRWPLHNPAGDPSGSHTCVP